MAPSSEHGSYSATSIRNGLVAGYSAGITGIVVGHPLDSIKVLLQTSGGVSGDKRLASSSSTSAAASISTPHQHVASRTLSTTAIQSGVAEANASAAAAATSAQNMPAKSSQGSVIGKRSLRALYAGATGPLLTTGILQSLNFAIYDSTRRVLYQRQIQNESPHDMSCNRRSDDYLHYDNLSNVAIASFAAGASTSVLTSPMVLIKTKQQLMEWGFRKAIKETYNSGLNANKNILKGLGNFYTGFGVHFICDAFGRSVYMFSYELLKRQLAQVKSNEQSSSSFELTKRVSTKNLSVADRILCAASSGMVCWAFIFPADVIRSKLYAKSLTSQSPLTTRDGINLARQMVKEQGFRSLYRGVGITVARAGPVAAAVLPVYDSVLAWVSS